MNETKYTEELKTRFRAKKWYIKKNSDKFFSGWPDLTAIRDGIVLFIEVKVESNGLSELQRKTLIDIAKAGGLALVMRRRKDHEYVIQVLPTGEFTDITDIIESKGYKELMNIPRRERKC